MSPTSTNREYKDRLFKAIFGRDTEENKHNLLKGPKVFTFFCLQKMRAFCEQVKTFKQATAC
ncbi:MAG: hypothetical protein IKR40_05580 [Treponema sp.]|nr:hypothetical protein [Treponema sp.]